MKRTTTRKRAAKKTDKKTAQKKQQKDGDELPEFEFEDITGESDLDSTKGNGGSSSKKRKRDSDESDAEHKPDEKEEEKEEEQQEHEQEEEVEEEEVAKEEVEKKQQTKRRGRPRKIKKKDKKATEEEQQEKPKVEVFDTEYEVECIMYGATHKGKTYYLVKWKNYPISDYTWEPAEHMESVPELVEEFESAVELEPSIARRRYLERPRLSPRIIVDEMTNESGKVLYKIAWKKHPVKTWEPSDSDVITNVLRGAWRSTKARIARTANQVQEDGTIDESAQLTTTTTTAAAAMLDVTDKDNWPDIEESALVYNTVNPGSVKFIRNMTNRGVVVFFVPESEEEEEESSKSKKKDKKKEEEVISVPLDVFRRTHPQELLDFLISKLSFGNRAKGAASA